MNKLCSLLVYIGIIFSITNFAMNTVSVTSQDLQGTLKAKKTYTKYVTLYTFYPVSNNNFLFLHYLPSWQKKQQQQTFAFTRSTQKKTHADALNNIKNNRAQKALEGLIGFQKTVDELPTVEKKIEYIDATITLETEKCCVMYTELPENSNKTSLRKQIALNNMYKQTPPNPFILQAAHKLKEQLEKS